MHSDGELLVISVSGRDRPGITAAFSAILQRSGVRIVDVEQATLQDVLALSFLVDLQARDDARQDVLKDLLFQAKEMDLDLNFRVFSEAEMVTRKKRFLYVITCISDRSLTDVLADVTPILAQRNVNIVTIRCLAEKHFAALELIADGTHAQPPRGFRAELLRAAARLGIDLGVQLESVYRRAKRLIVFDMDSTLISQEIIDELARARGVADQVSHITRRAMAGEIEFTASLVERVEALAGLRVEQMRAVAKAIALNEGVERVLQIVKRLGFRVALISGGFNFFTEYLRAKLGLDYAYGNVIEMRDGVATGRLSGSIIDAEAKARLLNEIAARENIHPQQVVAIGDGANDVAMLSQAGLGIAYRAKPRVHERADAALSGGMLGILHLLGITENDLATLENAESGASAPASSATQGDAAV